MSDAVKFRASSVGNLMVGGNAITEAQLTRLKELEARKYALDAKPLTPKMEEELAELIEKRDGEFKFGTTATTYIRDCWLKNMFGYDEPIVTNEMLKGIMLEDEAIKMLARHVPGGSRCKNEESFEDDDFTGTPDVLVDKNVVEDLKCSWTLRTFIETDRPDPLYYAQGQVYMALTGRSWFRLVHVLMDTPFELVQEEKKKFYYRFNCDENNPRYIEACAKVERMHWCEQNIPESYRIKVFEIGRNDNYIAEMRSRVAAARKVYSSLRLEEYRHEHGTN